jgi:hypothetical protein
LLERLELVVRRTFKAVDSEAIPNFEVDEDMTLKTVFEVKSLS